MNTMLSPIKVNSNTIELIVHTPCYWVLYLLSVTYNFPLLRLSPEKYFYFKSYSCKMFYWILTKWDQLTQEDCDPNSEPEAGSSPRKLQVRSSRFCCGLNGARPMRWDWQKSRCVSNRECCGSSPEFVRPEVLRKCYKVNVKVNVNQYP